jgi:hypothetical protein
VVQALIVAMESTISAVVTVGNALYQLWLAALNVGVLIDEVKMHGFKAVCVSYVPSNKQRMRPR